MVNKLRGFAAATGGGLLLLSLWAVVRYGDRPGAIASFGLVALGAVGIATLPIVLAYGKLALERWQHRSLGGATYVSEPLDVDRATFMDDTLAAFDGEEGFVAVKSTRFPEGRGLIIDHTAFHGTFVRFTNGSRIVVTGVTVAATETLIEALEGLWSTTMRQSSSNPFVGPIPVRGAPRMLLSIGLVVLVVLEVMALAGAAYPSAAYNSGEQTVLVGIDLITDLNPEVTRTEGRLMKASFLVSVLREEAIEIRWAANRTEAGPPDTSAAVIAADVDQLLAGVMASNPTRAQRARVEEIREDLVAAEQAVRTARERAGWAANATRAPTTTVGPGGPVGRATETP